MSWLQEFDWISNMNNLSPTNTFKNNAKSSNKINISVFKGNLSGNIIEQQTAITPVVVPCEENSFDFSCEENSKYLPII